jgi:hypothetical protein
MYNSAKNGEYGKKKNVNQFTNQQNALTCNIKIVIILGANVQRLCANAQHAFALPEENGAAAIPSEAWA